MNRIDLNSKLNSDTYHEGIATLTEEISKKASKDLASSSNNGLMSREDKTKIDKINLSSLLSAEIFNPEEDRPSF